jgi:hypothetical protein
MKTIIALLLSAIQMLTFVVSHPETPESVKQANIDNATQIIVQAKETLANPKQTKPMTKSIPTPITNPVEPTIQQPVTIETPVQSAPVQQSTPIAPEVTPTFGSVAEPTPELNCSLTASSNVAKPEGYVEITWTSNADTAVLNNNHIVYQPGGINLKPAQGGKMKVQLSSEAGEMNTITATFIGLGQTKQCEVNVLTQN